MGKAVKSSVKTVFRVDYRPSLDFYDRLYSVANTFVDDYPDWITDRLKVTLRDYRSRRSLLISQKAFVYSQDVRDSASKEKLGIERALVELPEALGKGNFARVGLRRKYLLPVEMEYQELVALFGKKMLTSNPDFQTGLFPDCRDLSLVFNFQPPGFSSVTIAPVYRQQLSDVSQILDLQIDDHFERDNEKFKTGQFFEDYPLHSVFLDVDYAENDVDAPNLPRTYKAAAEAHSTFVENVQPYLFGVE